MKDGKKAVADLVITNGMIINSGNVFEGNIVIEGEKIVAVTDKTYIHPADQYIDARRKYLFPGLIDVHTHFSYDDFRTLSQCAAFGGLTTILPFIRGEADQDMIENIRKYQVEGKQVSVVDYAFHIYLFDQPKFIENIPRAVELGVNSFKMFLAYKKRGMMVSTQFMLKAFQAIRSCGGLGMVHAEEGELIDFLENQSMAAGRKALTDFAKTCPDTAEEIAMVRAIELADLAQCPLYIMHLSTLKGLRLLEKARKEGKNVFTETCPQYLLLTDEDVLRHGPHAKIGPPLRSRQDNEALWGGLKEGAVSVVSSDHSAHPKEAKDPGWMDIFQAPFGMPGVETLAPLIYHEGVVKRNLPLTWFAKVMSENPARIFGLYPRKGVIQVGSDADVTFFDPEKEVAIQTGRLHSKAGYCVYEGRRLKGYPVMTVLRGQVLLNDGKLQKPPGSGKFLARPA